MSSPASTIGLRARRLVALNATSIFTSLAGLVCGLSVVGFLIAGGLRAVYPYPIDTMEDANLQVVRQILRGQPMYAAPTLTYVPVIYPPLYFLLSAALALVTGPSLIPLRVVSLIASSGATALVYRMVQREVGSRSPALIAAAVFLGSTQLSITSLDLGRVDALGVFFLLASLYAMRTADLRPGAEVWASAVSGALAGLAVMTKQPNALLAVALLGYAAVSPRARLAPYALALLATTLLPLAALYARDGSWLTYYLFTLPRAHVLDDKHLGNFWTLDVFPRFTLPLVLGPLFLVVRAVRRDLSAVAFYALATGVMVALAWAGWANRGAGFNVYEPAFAILSILFGLGLAEALTLLRAHTPDVRLMRSYVMAIGLVQFVILGYNPRATIPLRSDGWAGDRLTATLAALPGTVFAPSHGEWAYRAGKGDQPSSTTVMELTGSFSDAPAAEGYRWLDEFSNALAKRQYDYVIWDPGYLDAFVIKSRVESAGYVDAGPLFPPGDDFYNWKTGTTPEVEEYVPRERLARSPSKTGQRMTIRINRAIEQLEQDHAVYYTGGHTGHVLTYEQGRADAHTWADYINVGMEHGAFDMTGLAAYMTGLVDGGPAPTGHRTPTVVVESPVNGIDEASIRFNAWQFRQILARGVHGVLLCQAESADAVRAFVEACRYPHQISGQDPQLPRPIDRLRGAPMSRPGGNWLGVGVRGRGSESTAAPIWGLDAEEYLARCDAWPLNPRGELLLGVKLESPEGVAHCEAILDVPGLGFAELGPGDLGLSLGYVRVPRDPYPLEMAEARARVFAACRARSIPFLEGATPENVVAKLDEGVRVIAGGREETANIGRAHTRTRTR